MSAFRIQIAKNILETVAVVRAVGGALARGGPRGPCSGGVRARGRIVWSIVAVAIVAVAVWVVIPW